MPETADGTQDDDFEFTGEVTILNQSIIDAGTSVNVSLESNTILNSSSDSEMVEKSYALLNLPEI